MCKDIGMMACHTIINHICYMMLSVFWSVQYMYAQNNKILARILKTLTKFDLLYHSFYFIKLDLQNDSLNYVSHYQTGMTFHSLEGVIGKYEMEET